MLAVRGVPSSLLESTARGTSSRARAPSRSARARSWRAIGAGQPALVAGRLRPADDGRPHRGPGLDVRPGCDAAGVRRRGHQARHGRGFVPRAMTPVRLRSDARWTDGDAAKRRGRGHRRTQALLAIGSEGLIVKDRARRGGLERGDSRPAGEPPLPEGLACSIEVDRLRSGDLAFVVDGQVSRGPRPPRAPDGALVHRGDVRGDHSPRGAGHGRATSSDDAWKIVLGDESGRALRVELDVKWCIDPALNSGEAHASRHGEPQERGREAALM